MTPVPSSPYADLRSRLDAAEIRALAIVERLPAAARRRRPAQDRWCVDEIVDHLAIAIERYGERVEAAFRKASAAGGRRAPGPRLSTLGRWLTRALEPGTKAMAAPAAFRPRVSTSGEGAARDVVVRFKEANAALPGPEFFVMMPPFRNAVRHALAYVRSLRM